MNLLILFAVSLLNAVTATRLVRPPTAHSWTNGSYNVSGEKRVQSFARLVWLLTRNASMTWIGLQEAKWVGKKRIPALLRRRGWKRPKHWHHDTQIWFREARGFVATGSRIVGLAKGKNHWIEPAAAGPTKADYRIANVLEGEQDGVPVARISIHLVPSIHFERADRLSEAQIASLANLISYYLAHDYEVELVGDFNMIESHENLRPLLRLGLRVINDEWTHSKGTAKSQRKIDLIMVSEGIEEVGKSRTIFGHRKDDHRIPLARCRMRRSTINRAFANKHRSKKR